MIRLLTRGNRDERCYVNDHKWGSEIPYFWNWDNGAFKRCLVCGREVVDDPGIQPWFDTSLLNDERR